MILVLKLYNSSSQAERNRDSIWKTSLNPMMPRQSGRYFVDGIFIVDFF